jgi:hypothetical protein
MNLRALVIFVIFATLAAAACGDDASTKGKVPTNATTPINNTSSNTSPNATTPNATTPNATTPNATTPNVDPMLCGNGTVDPGELCDSGIATGDGSCPNSCAAPQCQTATVTGTAATCTATCSYADITVCQSGDGCCPAGCTNANDSDCSATCGNGMLDPGETCDGDCPTTCSDNNSCTSDVLVGNPQACSASCRFDPITACQGGDGCCPAGCNANNDSDCGGMCGNQTVEPGETCDGNCPTSCVDNNACTADSISGSAATCNVVCSNTPITACQSGDGCCPANCTFPTDMDCSCMPAVCGGAGRECGNPTDGCGGTLNCGSCPTGFSCSNFTCVATASNDIGDPCTQDNQCGPGGVCGLNPNFKDGYCTKSCMFDNDCPSGSHCGNKSGGVGECLANCLSDNDCRDGYACYNYDDDQNGINECAPSGTGTKSPGEVCAGVYECAGGTAAECRTNPSNTTTYCTVPCNALLSSCPTGSICDLSQIFLGYCLDTCTVSCRSGFTCTTFTDINGTPTGNGCVPN